jgi:hypothetical protein
MSSILSQAYKLERSTANNKRHDKLEKMWKVAEFFRMKMRVD